MWEMKDTFQNKKKKHVWQISSLMPHMEHYNIFRARSSITLATPDFPLFCDFTEYLTFYLLFFFASGGAAILRGIRRPAVLPMQNRFLAASTPKEKEGKEGKMTGGLKSDLARWKNCFPSYTTIFFATVVACNLGSFSLFLSLQLIASEWVNYCSSGNSFAKLARHFIAAFRIEI